MKIARKPPTAKKIIILVISLLALGVAGYFAYSYYLTTPNHDKGDTHKVNYDKPTDEQVETGQDIKQNNLSDSSPKVNPKTGVAAPADNPLAAHITSADINDGTLYIRNLINGIYSDGTCKLTLKHGTKTVTKTAGIQPLPKSSTCKGFNVATIELSPGTWQITLTVSIHGTSVSDSTNVTI